MSRIQDAIERERLPQHHRNINLPPLEEWRQGGMMVSRATLIESTIEAIDCMVALIETPISSEEGKKTMLDHLKQRRDLFQKALDDLSDR